ncbi:PepSY domain-containing protein [Alkalilimnicola sp. S0819]|uniref:PepSY domain-containing protein n=1 Tax=Alkalilimnicola sp. S0819 TaxID=2613922 RepID=UPI00186A0E0C|nr:PepSY domain-containing protein [Alkalilimnicola sp. S0819]
MNPKRLLFLAHRWLGIFGCLLFAAWFVSGVVMMYVPFPHLDEHERLAGLADLSPADCCAPVEALRAVTGEPIDALRLNMAGDRPVYHVTAGERRVSRYADDLSPVAAADTARLLSVAAAHLAEPVEELRYLGPRQSDQWTVSGRFDRHRPLHRIASPGPDGQVLYLSAASAEVLLDTDRLERGLNWVGAVVHWLYFKPLREHRGLWRQLLIGLALLACLAALSGLIVGIMRLRPRRRYRGGRITPYRGMMGWHHWTGLLFGIATLGWVFSGLLSMNPWGLIGHPAIGPAERAAMTGGELRPERFGLAARAALAAGPAELREVRWRRIGGEPYYQLLAADGSSRLVHGDTGRTRPGLRRVELEALAAGLRPEVPRVDALWLEDYDNHYYARRGERRLPVLRLRLADPPQTWYYLDPADGRIAAKRNQGSRLYRWLFNGLHSWDFPALVGHRPLWDLWMIGLSLGGLLLSLTGVVIGWRWLRRRTRPPRRPSLRGGSS